MRERTTWQAKGRETARQAATHRRAEEAKHEDIYNMNVSRPKQPAADAYEVGGPSDWAEDVSQKHSVDEEYDGKGVKRNELGFGEFRGDTFKRPDWGSTKYDNRTASEQRAVASHRLATALLKTEDRALVRKVAVGFMSLPDAAIKDALQAVEAVKPAALPDEARFKRAYACTKLAARVLGEGADEPTVERLARDFFKIDDPTLKSIVKTVASARIAQQEEQDDEEQEQDEDQDEAGESTEEPVSATSSSSATSAKSGKSTNKGLEAMHAKAESAKSAVSHTGEEEEDEDEDEDESGEGESAEMPVTTPPPAAPAVMAPPMAPPVAPAPVEATGEECWTAEEMGDAGLGEHEQKMMAEMQAPAEEPGHHEAPVAAHHASGLGINFDEEEAPLKVHTSALEALFSDDPEVKAQREILAANRESLTGFNMNRTASAKGAKKLGAVRAAKETVQAPSLDALWDRP